MINWKQGVLSGLQTTWMLGKIVFPVTFLITILGFTPVLGMAVDAIAPAMSWIGLPGEAAVPLVLGNFLNLYAAIGAILSLELTVKEVFIIAAMLSFSHNLLVESGVAIKAGVRLWIVLVVRIGLALLAAVTIHLVWQGGGETASYGFVQLESNQVSGAGEMILSAAGKAVMGVLQLAVIVIPLMVFIQIMKDLNWMNMISARMAPITKRLGMNENTSFTLLTGLVFGLAMGAGVMLQAVREDGVSKKDATLAMIFLVACHAVVEDTLIFIPLGIPVLPLLLIRLVSAVVLTVTVAYFWKRSEASASKKQADLHAN